MLQMTCAAIGRESPKSDKRRCDESEKSSISVASVESVKINQSKSPKITNPSPRASPIPDRKLGISKKLIRDKKSSPQLKHSHEVDHCLKSNTLQLNAAPGIPIDQQAMISQLMSQSIQQSQNGLTQNAELDRYLRASAQLYNSAFPHPAFAGYPTLPGLMPSMGYMPYLQNSWGAGMFNQNLGVNIPVKLRGFEPEETPKTASPGTEICNWGNCGKKFASSEHLATHVKTEHLSQTAPSTSGSSNLGPMPSSATLQSNIPRFSPYSIPGYPRDLLSSRYVYS